MTRVRLATSGAAVLALALSIAVLAGSPRADATQGQPVIAGVFNAETAPTILYNTSLGMPECAHDNNAALVACGGLYARSIGADAAVRGYNVAAGATGVRGGGGNGGTGVFGSHVGTTGIGVHGQTAGVGSAVYGEATGNGVALNGETSTGIGVRAKSSSGNALEVMGKATFSRSGTVTIAAGTSARSVPMAGVTAGSMVFATAQQNAAVFVKSVVSTSGSFTIRLTGNAPAGGLKVAYFVLN